jgi:hypothetical protein
MQKKASPNKKTRALYPLAYIALIVVALLIIAFYEMQAHHLPSPPQTISDLISNPATWENQEVQVQGIIQETNVGIIQPFNSWLSDPKNQTIRIGVKTPTNDYPAGNWVEVIGILRKGYAYVQPHYPGSWVYFINASSIICP